MSHIVLNSFSTVIWALDCLCALFLAGAAFWQAAKDKVNI
jgi:hypothetical protein